MMNETIQNADTVTAQSPSPASSGTTSSTSTTTSSSTSTERTVLASTATASTLASLQIFANCEETKTECDFKYKKGSPSPAIDLLVPSDTSDFEETGEPESEWLSEAIYVPFDLKYLPKHAYVVDLHPEPKPISIQSALREQEREQKYKDTPWDYGTFLSIGVISTVIVLSAQHILVEHNFFNVFGP